MYTYATNTENPVIPTFFCDLGKKKLFLSMLLGRFMLTSICMKNADIRIFLSIIDNHREKECLDMNIIFSTFNSIDVTLSRNLRKYTKGESLGLNNRLR